MNLKTENLVKRFGNFTALKDINLEIAGGELAALLGPSGCGKTTLLRIFAGLEEPDGGRVLINDEDQSGIEVRRRKVGFVFQHYALFRHMSVFENVAFGLRAKPRKDRPSRQEIAEKVHEVLSLVQLDNQAAKYPDQLSGGQRQRIALARSLVVNPKILLLDEPFGALDANVRRDLRRWLRRLHDEIKMTTILVTHDQEEALELADKVILLNQGRLEQSGSPEEVYRNPANSFVYEFLGSVNVFHGRLEAGRFMPSLVSDLSGGSDRGGLQKAYVRPHEFEVLVGPPEDKVEAERQELVRGTLKRLVYSGPLVRLEIEDEAGQSFDVSLGLGDFEKARYEPGQAVWLRPLRYKTFLGEGI